MGKIWTLVVGILTPLVLGYMLISEIYTIATKGYGGYPSWFINTFGWGMAGALIVIAILLSRIHWYGRDYFKEEDHE